MPGESNELLSLRSAQQNQILDQHRVTMYNLDLRLNLIIKLLEEKGIFVPGEFDKRWPLFLKNDIGAIGPDGIMEGSLKIYFYEK
jgi:hypothetical protein